MRKALFLTAYNRPQYFKQVLDSWALARGLEDWDIYIQIEPNVFAEEQAQMARLVFQDHPSVEVLINPQVYGVLHNPWVGFERLFMLKRYDFVIRGEDDLIVSADILEYFDYCSSAFQNEPSVAAVLGYSDDNAEDSHELELVDGFGPWVWGTWFDRWEGFLGPTWDHDYSTFNGQPGNEAGWDWNINTRLYPQHGLKSVVPSRSRVQNIGVSGTHAIEEEYHTSISFSPDHGTRDFRLLNALVDS